MGRPMEYRDSTISPSSPGLISRNSGSSGPRQARRGTVSRIFEPPHGIANPQACTSRAPRTPPYTHSVIASFKARSRQRKSQCRRRSKSLQAVTVKTCKWRPPKSPSRAKKAFWLATTGAGSRSADFRPCGASSTPFRTRYRSDCVCAPSRPAFPKPYHHRTRRGVTAIRHESFIISYLRIFANLASARYRYIGSRAQSKKLSAKFHRPRHRCLEQWTNVGLPFKKVQARSPRSTWSRSWTSC